MSFGAECFLCCELNGFKGQIKKTWQDFVVTEIDSQGNQVKLIPSEIVSAMENEQDDQSSRSKTKLKKEKREKQQEEKSLDDVPFFNKMLDSFEELKDVALKNLEKCLSNEKMIELSEFAMFVETNRDTEKRISLALWFLDPLMPPLKTRGSVPSKELRTGLHRNIRLAFPHLLTETTKSDQEGQPPLILVGYDKVYWEFSNLLNDRDQVDRLLCFAHWENRRIPSTLSIDVSSADKQQRTKIHRLLAKHFGSFLESKTFNNLDDKIAGNVGKSYIQIRMRAKGAKSPYQQKSTQNDQRQIDPEYTGFVLCKRNMETLEAIQRLSACLNIQPSAFSYAGIKDKKAITTQYMVVRGVTPEQMRTVEGHPSLEGIELGSYRRGVRTPLRMGALSGNHFQVVIRNMECKASHEDNLENCEKNNENAMSLLSHFGFLNYFGPQRFGLDDKEVNACDIGLAMLQGDMIKAVKLLLTPSDHSPDHPVNIAKRYYCETGDVQGTVGKMPGFKVRETLVLKALHRHGTDMDGCRKALLNIPYPMRLLYVHSYCSLIWNYMASYRIQRYGRSAVVEGDLVVDKAATAHGLDRQTAYSSHACTLADDSGALNRDHVKCIASHEQEVYRLRDIVLPLPGYNVQYPANDVGETYKKRLESDGLTTKNFRLRSLGINVPGAYRKLVAFPRDLFWTFINKTSAETGTSVNKCESPTSSNFDGEDVKRPRLITDDYCRKGDIEEELFISGNCCNDVKISFFLEPSCYATSCLRELMKN